MAQKIDLLKKIKQERDAISRAMVGHQHEPFCKCGEDIAYAHWELNNKEREIIDHLNKEGEERK
jgi:hypothetical protein